MKEKLTAPDGSVIYADDNDRREFHEFCAQTVQDEIDKEIIQTILDEKS